MNTSRVTKVLLSGSFWVTVGEILAGVTTFATGVLAARVLSPRDFGLMGTVALALSILEHFSQTGFDSALVHKKKGVRDYLDIAWTWHVLRGLLITAILCASAPFIADFYDEPLLLPLMLACSASAILLGASNVGTVYFTRDLEFRALFFIKSGQILIRALIFVPAILYFRNVWALVVGHLAGATVHIIISYIAHPYRPKLRWDRAKLKELMAYGKWITAIAWIGFVIGKGDDLFVSKYVGIAALGLYQLSYDISNTPTTNITHVIGRIGLPTYAKLQDDREELKRAFVNVMRATLMISGPVTVVIYIAVPDIVAHVIGSKWAPTIVLVRILVVSGFIRSFAALAGPLFQATGRPDLDFKMNLPRFFCVLLLVWPFAAYWDLAGVCFVVLIAIATCLPTWFYGVNKLTGLRIGEVIKHNLLAFVSAAILAACYHLIRGRMGVDMLSAASGLLGGLAAWMVSLYVLGRLSPLDFFGELARLRAATKGD